VLRKLELVVAIAAAMVAVQAQALTLDFEGFAHGQIVSPPEHASYQGIVISVDNFEAGHPDHGVVFDSENQINTADPDLEHGAGWAAGNLASSSVLGNILIIQENNNGCDDFVCDNPDDEARRQAGTITLSLSPILTPFSSFEFDLIDLDEITAENGSIEFLIGGVQAAFFGFDEFTGVTLGDNSANHINIADLGDIGSYDEVVITMGGSGGVDNLLLTAPEPDTLALTSLGLAGLAVVGRSRR
jgi:hypothetical protein